MNNNFEEEIKVLIESKNIKDKTMIISIYSDFYNEMSSSLAFGYLFLVPEYKEFLTSVFKSTVRKFESMNRSCSYVDFFKDFLNTISDSLIMKKITNYPIHTTLEYYINKFNVDDDFHKEMPYVSILDSIDMDLFTKSRIIFILKEHFKKFDYNFTALHNTKYAIHYVKIRIINNVVSLLPEIISRSTGFESFEQNLKRETYNVISTIVTPDYPTVGGVTDHRLSDYYGNLSDKDKDIMWSLILTFLSGYDKDCEKDNERISFSNIKYNVRKLSLVKKLGEFGYKPNVISIR